MRISGTVQDQSGALILNAVVTLQKGAETQTATTTVDGAFVFDRLGTGTYDVRVDQPGFKTATARVVIGSRVPRPIDFKLQIATLQQELTVAGDDLAVSTDTANNLDVAALDRNALDNAPIFDQNYIATISRFLDSGAIGTNGMDLLSRAYNNTSGIGSFPANSYDLSSEWGRADFDQRHRLNVLGTSKAGKLFNFGAGVFLNTGRPYSLTTGRDEYNIGSATARPPRVGRNTLEGPGYAEYDLRWFRDFTLAPPRDEVAPALTISVDAFNLFNQVNYTSYVGNLSSPFYGHAVSAQPPRRLQFSTRFAF